MTTTLRRSHVSIAATAVAAALVLSACGGTTKGGDTGSGGGLGDAPGFDASSRTFTVTALEPLSGPISSAGLALSNGMKVYFDELNAKGGVAGKYKVNYDGEDTQFNPQTAVPLYNRTKDDTIMYSGILGTSILKSLAPQIKTDNVTAVVDSSSANYVHTPNLLSWGTPSQVNMVNLMAYAVDKLNKRDATFCSVTTGDDLGAENRDGIKYAVGKLGVKYAVDVPVNQGETNLTPHVQQLQRNGCDVVMLGVTTAQVPALVSAASQLTFNAQFLGQNNVYDPSFASSAIAPYLQQHLLTTLIGVDWNSDAPGQAAFRAAIDKQGANVKPSPYAELGYAHAMFVAAVLAKAVERKDVSRAGILAASQSVGSFDYQGMLPSYDYSKPADRKPSLATGIYRVDPGVPMGLSPVEPAYQSKLAAQYPIAS